MKLAVVQHRMRNSAIEDAAALVGAARQAAEHGAELVVFPDVPSLADEGCPERQFVLVGLDDIPGRRLFPSVGVDVPAFAAVAEPLEGLADLGKMALLVGDACIDPAQIGLVASCDPPVTVLMPRNESDLQAEAMLEFAIGLTDALSGLVLVAACTGAASGDPGHGGSAIVLLGEVLAEALGDADVLLADVAVPVPQPEPRDQLPSIPPMLQQRLASHRGQKVPVDYPADLS